MWSYLNLQQAGCKYFSVTSIASTLKFRIFLLVSSNCIKLNTNTICGVLLWDNIHMKFLWN